jgi:hypothetical protein
MTVQKLWFGLLAFGVLLAAMAAGWSVSAMARPAPTAFPTIARSPTASLTAEPTATTSPVPSWTPTSSPTPTASPTFTPAGTTTPTVRPSRTPSITPTPTYDPPDARVLAQANCRYGPGAAYLYEWGLYPTDRVEIHGRNDQGTWVYVDPWTYVDRCWVRADLLDVFRGDLFEAPVYNGRLPFSVLYKPPTNVRASRNGNEVQIVWNAVWMTEDDDRGYLVEAWVCQAGQLVFTPIHVSSPPAWVQDEPGCPQPSFARLYTAEKHGYTQWVKVPWPEHTSAP